MTASLRLLTTVLFAGCVGSLLAGAPEQPPSGVARGEAIAATVGPSAVSAASLDEAIASARRRAVAEHRLDAFTSGTPDRLLDDLIDVKLFALAARDRGLDRRLEVIRRVEAAVDQVLAQAAVTDAAGQPALTDESIASYFESHRDRFRSPPRIRARHIVVRSVEEARAARDGLAAGADFEAIARERNIDSTRASGGDLGWVTKGTMVAAFDAALFALASGETSDMVATNAGFHIVRAEEIEPGRLPALAAVVEQVRSKMVEARVSALRQQLLARYPITRHRDVIASLKK